MQTYLLLAREDSSDISFPFPFVVLVSRVRFVDKDGVEVCSAEVRSFSFSFCFAAFTRALERNTLVSAEDPGTGADCSSGCDVDGLQLLVTSC